MPSIDSLVAKLGNPGEGWGEGTSHISTVRFWFVKAGSEYTSAEFQCHITV